MVNTTRVCTQPPPRHVGSRHLKGLTRRRVVLTQASLQNNTDLVSALLSAARKQTRPWLEDLILPFLGVDFPGGIDANDDTIETVHRTQLADEDSKFVTVHGIELHYKEWVTPGSDPVSCPTVLLLHGFNGSVFSWRANVYELAQAAGGCRIIAFDRPPFGLSERPNPKYTPFDPYNADGNVTLAEGFLDRLDLFKRPLIVVGHSAGAVVALNLYSRRPKDIAALALVAPAVPTTTENRMLRNATFGALLRFLAVRTMIQTDDIGLRYVRRQLLRQRDKILAGELGFQPHPSTAQVNNDSEIGTEEEEEEEALRWAIQGYLKPLQAHDWDKAALCNLRSFDLPASYPYETVRVPVLVLQGKYDGQLTKNARALRTLLPPNPKTVYKELECGHVPMEELPLEFNDIVKEYLDAVLGSAADQKLTS